MSDIKTLEAEAAEIDQQCSALVKSIDKTGRAMTDTERDQIASLVTRRKTIETDLSEARNADTLKSISEIFGPVPVGGTSAGSHRGSGLQVKGFLSHKAISGTIERKAVLETGAIVSETPLVAESVRLQERATHLHELFPVATIGTQDARVLKQTVRTNNADTVAAGGTKPTSVFTFDSSLVTPRVIAHLSEGIDRSALDDSAMLAALIEAELRYGALVALDDQILNGTGTAPDLDGISATSGIGSTTFDTDMLTSLRKGITALEVLDVAPTDVIMTPADWETIELTASTSHFVMGGAGNGPDRVPVDRSARRVWGLPVLVTNAATAGTATVLDANDVLLVMREQTRIDATETSNADDFSKNLVRIRAELRANVAVLRPTSINEVALTA